MGCRVANPCFELLMLRFVFTHLNIPTGQLGCEAGILSSTANRLGKILFVHRNVHNFVFLIESNTTNQGGLESFGDELRDVVIPPNNVNTLIIEFAHDIFYSSSAQAYTGAHWINFVIVSINSHFSAVAGLASHRPEFNGAIGNLSHF